MKTNFFFNTLYCSIIFLISCSQNKNDFASIILNTKPFVLNQEAPWKEINVKNAIDISVLEYANLIGNRKYVYLNSKELIGNIDRLLIYKDKIYVLDYTVKERIFIFKLTGELIKIINNQGRGPEEYIGLSDIYR